MMAGLGHFNVCPKNAEDLHSSTGTVTMLRFYSVSSKTTGITIILKLKYKSSSGTLLRLQICNCLCVMQHQEQAFCLNE